MRSTYEVEYNLGTRSVSSQHSSGMGAEDSYLDSARAWADGSYGSLDYEDWIIVDFGAIENVVGLII